MSAVYLTGGEVDLRQKNLTEKSATFAYSNGLILQMDTATRSVREVIRYRSPADRCPQDAPSILFKSGSRVGDRLELCTTTEIMRCQIGEWRMSGVISLPMFNDVHHVAISPGGARMVAVTGLDMVVELDANGALTREWEVMREAPWQRFSKTVDYRKVHSTKPHHSHPNYVFFIGDEPFVTRHIQRDAISLINPQRRIDIGVQGPHDGYVANGKVYFTTVDGHIVIADCATLKVVNVYNLRQWVKSSTPLGWCRGFYLLEDGCFLVGFSRLRQTKFKENISWVKSQIGKISGGKINTGHQLPMPTRISCFDPQQAQHRWDVELEDHGMQAVFSIL